jgi:hypothetical protein
VTIRQFAAPAPTTSPSPSSSGPTAGLTASGSGDGGLANTRLDVGLLLALGVAAADYRSPVWPPMDGEQRPMMHVDFQVGDLDSAVDDAIALGASPAAAQPQENSGC